MARKVCYLSGPITDNPDYLQLFAEHERALEKMGYGVMNPTKLDDPKNPPPWHECIIRDLGYILLCDVIALLPGWEKSHGARIEVMFGIKQGKKFIIRPGAACGVDIRFSVSNHDKVEDEGDMPWGDEDDLENDDEKGWEDLGGMGDIPGWQ